MHAQRPLDDTTVTHLEAWIVLLAAASVLLALETLAQTAQQEDAPC